MTAIINRRPILAPKPVRSHVPMKGRRPPTLTSMGPGSTFTPAAFAFPGMTKILPWLFLGSARDAADFNTLRSNNISYILNVAKEVELPDPRKHGIHYYKIDLEDECAAPISDYFNFAYNFIEEARMHNAAILVHCRKGVSRSATLVISYVMKFRSIPFEEAYAFVRQRRSVVNPNLGFILALHSLDASLRGVTEKCDTVGVTRSANEESKAAVTPSATEPSNSPAPRVTPHLLVTNIAWHSVTGPLDTLPRKLQCLCRTDSRCCGLDWPEAKEGLVDI